MSIKENLQAYAIVGCAMKVHQTLGQGFLEAVYADALEIELKNAGIPYEREKEIYVIYNGIVLWSFYKADFLCYDQIIVELKAIKQLGEVEWAQALNYLKASGKPYALLINFGDKSLRYEYILSRFQTPPPRSVSEQNQPISG